MRLINPFSGAGCLAEPFARRTLLTLTVFGAVLAAAAPAPAADKADSEITWVSSLPIVVASDGSNYIGVVASQSYAINGTIEVDLDAGVLGGIKDWSAHPLLAVVVQPAAGPQNAKIQNVTGFEESGQSKSYSIPRPSSVKESFPFTISKQAYADFAVAACNLHAGLMRDDGLSNQQIFGQHRTIQIHVQSSLDYEMSGPSGVPIPQEVAALRTVDVTCQASPEFAVTDASLEAEVVQTAMVGGTCELRLNGSVTSLDPNTTVTFRYHDSGGQKSAVKSVKTGGGKSASFEHIFSIELENGTSGKVRIIGEAQNFQTGWADYEVDCQGGPTTVETAVPPVPELSVGVVTEVLHKGFMCPEKYMVAGKLTGKGAYSGRASIGIEGAPRDYEDYSISGEETYTLLRSGEVSWQQGSIGTEAAAAASDQAPQRIVAMTLDVYNQSGQKVASKAHSETFTCRVPEPPESLIQAISVTEEIVHQNKVCPGRVRLTGTVIAQADGSSGTVWVAADSQPLLETPYDFEAGKGEVYKVDHELSWENKPATTQSIKYSLVAVAPDGEILAQSRITKDLSCRSTAFDIVSPKGQIRAGEADDGIRLAGGLPGADYTLRFFRRSGGVYEIFESAELPTAMSGLSQSFPMAALTGSRFWRLEVCTAGETQGCKFSDFRKPLRTAQEPVEAVLIPDLVALPPEVSGLSDPEVVEEAVFNGSLCPVAVNLSAQITGQGSAFSGTAAVQVNGQQVGEAPFSVGADGLAIFTSVKLPYDVSWTGVPITGVTTPQQTIQFGVRLLDEDGEEVASDSRSAALQCRQPNWAGPPQGGNGQEGDAVPQELVLNPNLVVFAPKVSQISKPQVLEEVELNGMICPSEVGLKAQIVGQGSAFSGSAVMQVGAETLEPVPFSVGAEGLAVFATVNVPYDVSWTGVAFTGGAAPQQTRPLVVRLLNENGQEVGSKSVPAVFRCRKAPVAMTVGKVNFPLQILAPRNVATNGNIRLSGVEPGQDYTLQWAKRLSNGKWKAVTSAHLPGEMTGASASFNVHALESGTWRLRACKEGESANPYSPLCKVSKFQVVKKGGGSGPHTPPGGKKPEIMLITPGAINTN